MTQTGDPTGGAGGGKKSGIDKEQNNTNNKKINKNESAWGKGHLIPDEIRPALRHTSRGVVSMANSGTPDSNGSQFFITFDKHVHLDGKYTVIGHVIMGKDTTLTAIENSPVDKKNRPLNDSSQVLINSVTIHANPFAN